MRTRASQMLRAAVMTSIISAALPVASAEATDAVVDVSTPALTIPCSSETSDVIITTSVRLDAACTYSSGFHIVASHVVFDCNGALIQSTQGSGPLGIIVSTPADVDLADVVIRNCRVDGFMNNVHLARHGFQQIPAGHEYDHHLRGVVVEDSMLTNSRGVGIYVNGYVTNTTLRRLTITGSGSAGVYLDTGSRRAKVTGNIIADNGFRENGPGGTNTNFSGLDVRYWGPGREGIAVDGSGNNVITDNWIVGNSAGGIFLYTNCGENVHTDPNSWVFHRYGAEHNLIQRNVIAGGGTGVWVASRMGENVYPMDCSDVPYVSSPLQAITLDRAARNTIRSNHFAQFDFGVRVEDDRTVVQRNSFDGTSPTQYAVVVGTPYRTTVLGRPVAHTVLADNTSNIVANVDPYRWVNGYRDLRADSNTALGVARSVCSAPDIPRGPFVMTYTFAPQDPNLPPGPPPPYDVPSLGVLAPCGK